MAGRAWAGWPRSMGKGDAMEGKGGGMKAPGMRAPAKGERAAGESAPHEGRARTRDRRFRRTERAIREAFLKLMEQKDYRAITVAELSREADIDRKTFYLHYATVDEVADRLVREEAEAVVEALREEALSKDGVVDVASLFFNLIVGLVPDLVRTRRIARHISVDTLLAKIEGPLTEALLEEGSFSLEELGPYAGYCVSFFVAGLMAVYRRWLLSDSELPLEGLAAVANVAILEGTTGLARHAPDLSASA